MQRTEKVMITPAFAAELLNKNTENRPMSRHKVAKWVDQMETGKWKLTHQGVAISDAGVLLDGQHRLQAIVEYGKPVEMKDLHEAEGGQIEFVVRVSGPELP